MILGSDDTNTVETRLLLDILLHLVEGICVSVCFLAAPPYGLFVSKLTGTQ